jgi:acyl-coenzyme A synthetase/AMP-(fatty) acid ligase/acyl carrier protein
MPLHITQCQAKLPWVKMHNLYGPTEAAIDVTYWPVPQTSGSLRAVPIGKPVWNTMMYVLDSNMQLTGKSIVGDIYIGGVQVSRGYLNREELTAERFITNPYGEGRLYKTGDRGRWLQDGNLEYLGRSDDQVKIRGFRIEPGEVEHVLQGAPGVQQGVVVCPQEKDGQRRLVGYVVKGTGYDREEVLAYMKERLPDYMVPSLLSELTGIPLNSNGKADRKVLLSLGLPSVNTKYEAPRNEAERELVRIWEEVLGHENIGIHDSFFELGGNSMKVIRLVDRINQLFGNKIKVADLFNYKSVAEIGRLIPGQQSILHTTPTSIEEFEL